jgi:hydrogenase-4 component B
MTVTPFLLWAAAAAWLGSALIGVAARRRAFLWAAGASSAAGGAAAVAAGALLALNGHATTTLRGANTVVGQLELRATPLSAAFVALLGLVTLAIGCYAPRYHDPSRGTAAYLLVYNMAALASLAVLVAADVTTFLVAWESMTLLCALMVLRHQRRAGVASGAFLFLAIGELGFVMVTAALVVLATQAHSLDFALIIARAGTIPLGWRSTAFVLALLGFGCKAGLVPFHLWLPAAHPVAPADGSAFLSGLIINLGVYGIVLFAFELLRRGPAWWGLLAMALGALSAAIGILYALVEADLKRFLAYSSIENMGVIVTAVGAAMTFSAYRQSQLGSFLLIAGLYHVVNHGTYKTLLFLEAGVVEHATGTRDLNRLGGLVHRMGASTMITLVGTVGIAALPPLNGFVSEWLIFQGLFQGFRIPSDVVGILIVLAAAVLGLTGGLAIMGFARSFGIACLGMPRSSQAARATEEHQPIVGPAILAVACGALAVGAPAVLIALVRSVGATTGTDIRRILLLPKLTIIPAHTDFSAFSPTYLAVFLLAVTVVPVAIYLAGRPRGATQRVPVWDGGLVDFKARMQYTATTFANPVRVTFERLYQPDVHLDRASDDPAGRSGPVHYRIRVFPLFERLLYEPIVRGVQRVAGVLQRLQSGDVNLYLLYILVVVVVAYLVAVR